MTLNSQPCRGLSHIAGKFSCQPGEKSKAEHYHIADPDEVSEVKSDLVEIMEQDWTDPNALNMRRQEADLSPTNTSRSSFAEDSDVSSGSTSISEEKRAKDEKTLAIAGVAERDVADLGCETSTAQALQQRATAAKNSEDAAKVAAERHPAELALRKQLDVLHREALFRIKALEEEIQCLRAVATFQVDPPPTEEPETETSVGESSNVPSGSTSDLEEADPSPLNTSRSSFGEDSDVSSASTSPSKDRFWTPELVDAQRLIAELEEKNQALEESLSTLCEAAEKLLQATLAEVEGMPKPLASPAKELETTRLDWQGLQIHKAQRRFSWSASAWDMSLVQPEASRISLREEDSQEMRPRPRFCEGTFLPADVWPILLKFLPVAEVVRQQIRAVSSSFSSSKVWVEHLLHLMDLESLNKQCDGDENHPAIQYCKRRCGGLRRILSEGHAGYACWFNGLFMWHKLYPDISFDFVDKVMELHRSGRAAHGKTVSRLSGSVAASGIRELKLYVAKGLVEVLRAKDLERDACILAFQSLDCCESIFQHLGKEVVADLLEASTKYQNLCVSGVRQASVILETVLTNDLDAALAPRYLLSLSSAKLNGKLDEVERLKQNLVDLLVDRETAS